MATGSRAKKNKQRDSDTTSTGLPDWAKGAWEAVVGKRGSKRETEAQKALCESKQGYEWKNGACVKIEEKE